MTLCNSDSVFDGLPVKYIVVDPEPEQTDGQITIIIIIYTITYGMQLVGYPPWLVI